MPLHVTHARGVPLYNLSAGKTLPEWLKQKNAKALRNDEEYRSRIELLQDLDFPITSQRIRISPDGEFMAIAGNYPPMVRVYELSEMSMKFERRFDCDIAEMEILSPDYSKMVFLHQDRYIEFHAKFGSYFKTRIPKVGRAMIYEPCTCDLIIAGSSSQLYRLNLERGQFLAPFQTSAGAVNGLSRCEMHGLLACGTDIGTVECWDPRARRRAAVLDVCGTSSGAADDVGTEVTSVSLDPSGLKLAAGTSSGFTLLYDLRSSVPVISKDQNFGLPIKKIAFHPTDEQPLIASADSKILKLWNERTGNVVTSIEPEHDINDVHLHNDSGLLFLACEMPKVQVYFAPALGPAPKWCSFLDSLTEELEEESRQSAYDDYKFVTQEELERLGLGKLVGTAMLKPYMHGFFLDAKLYARAKSVADPFAYDAYRKERAASKAAAKADKRIVFRTNKAKVNAELLDQLEEDGQADKSAGNKKQRQKADAAQRLLSDNRFSAVFSDERFAIDKESEEYKLLHPSERHKQPANGDDSDEEELARVQQQLIDMEDAQTQGKEWFDADFQAGDEPILRKSTSKATSSGVNHLKEDEKDTKRKRSSKSAPLEARMAEIENSDAAQTVSITSTGREMTFSLGSKKDNLPKNGRTVEDISKRQRRKADFQASKKRR